MKAFAHSALPHSTQAQLAAVLLSRYLFFLSQRPVSASNMHYVRARIEGLRSLAPLLRADEHELLARSVRLLRTLDPGNLHEVSEHLQQTLFPFTRAEVPATYISADAPPPADLLRSSERILLVLGPAIGIGDEMITFPLPQWIKRVNPGVRLTTLTGYDGLWADVAGVDRVLTYRDLHALVRALRGEHEAGPADLVLLVDFENPDLYRVVTSEAQIARYAELSLGARVLSVVDNRAGWTYHQTVPRSYLRNVYDGFDELARRLGLAPDARDRIVRAPGTGDGPLRVLVSPFSSKYDPSPRYWSALLGRLIPRGPGRAVCFAVEPGPNARTRRFAREVVRAAEPHTHRRDVTLALAGGDRPRPFPLAAALAELQRADVVLCADSFPAHAGPRMGCTTLVIASPGLENWRVPCDRSYYFDAEAPLDAIVAGIRQILDLHGIRGAPPARPPLGGAEDGLRQADAELERAVVGDVPFDELCRTYERFRRARAAVVERVAQWPPGAAALVGDDGYDVPARGLDGNGDVPPALQRDTRFYVRDHWLMWRNTNLRKYLELRGHEVGA